MTNLTISLDEAIVRGARIRAIAEGTSVSAKVRDFLRQYVEGSAAQDVQRARSTTDRLMDSIEKAASAAKISAPAPSDTKAGGTLRGDLYADNFRQRARPATLQPRKSS